MDAYKRRTKHLIVIFFLIHIFVVVALRYLRYLTTNLLSFDEYALFEGVVLALVYVPFDLLVYKNAKLAGMKKSRIFFGLCLAIHSIFVIVYAIRFVTE